MEPFYGQKTEQALLLPEIQPLTPTYNKLLQEMREMLPNNDRDQ
jgi:hypothetical protein